jgi:hypothetical protein
MQVESCILLLDSLFDQRVTVSRETLVSVVDTLTEHGFIGAISAATKCVSIAQSYNTATLCILMISCSTYSLNARSLPLIPDTTFALLWGHIDMTANATLSVNVSMSFIQGRTESGYRGAMNVKEYQDTDILCKSSRQSLVSRQTIIDSRSGNKVIGEIGNIIDSGSTHGYFRSITSAICKVMGASEIHRGQWLDIESCKLCPDSSTKCLLYKADDICTGKSLYLCLEHGVYYSGAVRIQLEYQEVILCDEQMSSPNRSLDRNHYLPLRARQEWNTFTSVIQSNMQSPMNLVHKGCILVGSVSTNKCKYCIWFVRPSLAYGTWNYIAANGMAEELCRTIEHEFRRWRPYNHKEIHISVCSESRKPMVSISGTMTAIYYDNVEIAREQNSYNSVASFSGTTLRVQVITNESNSFAIQDVVCNNNLIQTLLPQTSGNPTIRHQNNCASVKWLTGRIGTGTGPRKTLGKNGGLQYVGRIDKVADSYAKICVLIRENMHTDKFRLHLSRANIKSTSMIKSTTSISSESSTTIENVEDEDDAALETLIDSNEDDLDDLIEYKSLATVTLPDFVINGIATSDVFGDDYYRDDHSFLFEGS